MYCLLSETSYLKVKSLGEGGNLTSKAVSETCFPKYYSSSPTPGKVFLMAIKLRDGK